MRPAEASLGYDVAACGCKLERLEYREGNSDDEILNTYNPVCKTWLHDK